MIWSILYLTKGLRSSSSLASDLHSSDHCSPSVCRDQSWHGPCMSRLYAKVLRCRTMTFCFESSGCLCSKSFCHQAFTMLHCLYWITGSTSCGFRSNCDPWPSWRAEEKVIQTQITPSPVHPCCPLLQFALHCDLSLFVLGARWIPEPVLSLQKTPRL